MQSSVKDPICPACLHNDVAEHIEVTPAESRAKTVDRRVAVDLTYLSLIEVDRRMSKANRRGIDNASTVVEDLGVSNMVCLVCAYEWYADSGSTSIMR